MGESIWKKEMSFKKKPKDQSDDHKVEPEAAASTSLWKKELSLKRKPKADVPVEVEAVADEPVAVPDPEPAVVELPAVELPAADLPVAEAAEQLTWKKEVSLSRATNDGDTVAADPVVDEQPGAPDPEPEETEWKKEVSFSRKPRSDEPLVVEDDVPLAEPAGAEADVVALDEPTVDLPLAAEEPLVSDEPDDVVEPAWTKEVSFSRKAETDTDPVAAEPVVEEPAVDEPVAEEPAFAEPVAEEPVAAEPVVEETFAEEPFAAAPVAAELEPVANDEPWSAPPVLPPAPVEDAPTMSLPRSVPLPAPAVHPPVPAAELPPLPVAAEETVKAPFWKKELSFGGKKREKTPKPPKEKKERKPKADKPERAPEAKKPKAKRAKGLKGLKRTKEPKQKGPKMRAERGAKAAKKIVGLKIGASQLAAARVSNNGSAELLQVAREPLEPGIVVGGELRDPDKLAAALKEFFAKNGLPKRGVRLGIANNRIGVRTFEISGIQDPKQLGNAIRFRAQEALPIPIDEAVLDYQVLGEGVDADGQPTQRILLVVAYRELIDRYVDACKKAGIVLAGIDLEAFALLRALQAPQDGVGADPTAALVAVAIGHERSTFAVSNGHVCEFTRVLEWGGSALNVAIARAIDAAPSEVEDVKRALALTDEMVPESLTPEQAQKAREAMRRAIQTFARELVSSLQYYQNQPGSLGIGEIVLTGGTAHLPGIAGELERLIGVRVRVGDPLARMKVSKKVGDPAQLGSFAIAIGLGIED
ncbi:MAG: type pilus assembly protein PilM [Gaiellaceae bacterium]|nr:type pilus assembly protein PilM [Gaiellaceae bacterium]